MSDLLNQASLVMVPSGYKEDTVYSVVPSDGSGDLSFTRASNGTRVNSAGLVEVCPWNLVQNSENFSAVWTAYQSTITSNTATAPNGTLTADSITDNSGNDVHIAYQTMAGIVAGTYTISLYAKASTLSHINLQWYDGTTFYTSNAFNLSNGTTTGANQSIESVGNGWYRCIFTFTTTVSGTQYAYVLLNNGTSNFYTGTGTGTVFIWGAQVNIGSTAKPYFPTTDRLNVPRLTYQNGGGGCPSLLLEKQSTNLVQYSEQFDNAWWTKGNGSVTANATTSPDGTTNADKFAEDSTNNNHYFGDDTTSATSGQLVTFTIFAKASERSWIAMRIYNGSGSVIGWYNIGSGTLGTIGGGGIASITSMGNGWYRCALTVTMALSSVFLPYVFTSTGDTILTYTGTSGSGVFVWGAQAEISSYPTSYIPTTSASATRVADACFKTGISSLIGQTEGTLFFQIERKSGDYAEPMWLSDGSYSNYIYFVVDNTQVRFIGVNSSGGQWNINTTALSQGVHKIAGAYKANDIIFYIDGVQIGTDTNAQIPTCSFLGLGYENTVAYNNGDPYSQVAIFPTRLTNAELASLTTI